MVGSNYCIFSYFCFLLSNLKISLRWTKWCNSNCWVRNAHKTHTHKPYIHTQICGVFTHTIEFFILTVVMRLVWMNFHGWHDYLISIGSIAVLHWLMIDTCWQRHIVWRGTCREIVGFYSVGVGYACLSSLMLPLLFGSSYNIFVVVDVVCVQWPQYKHSPNIIFNRNEANAIFATR